MADRPNEASLSQAASFKPKSKGPKESTVAATADTNIGALRFAVLSAETDGTAGTKTRGGSRNSGKVNQNLSAQARTGDG